MDSALLAEVRQNYEAGRYLDACRVALKAGPLQAWAGPEALTLGFRLAGNLGASRLADLLITRAYREAPAHPEAVVHYGYHVRNEQGHLAAWQHALKAESSPGIGGQALADLKTIRAITAGTYRDFETAWKLWQEAFALCPDRAWLLVEKASILQCEEKRLEALEALDEALHTRPWFRPAVQHRGRMLHLLGRADEAVQFLTEASQHLQSYAVTAQLMSLKRELDDHAGMAELADRVEAESLLLDSAGQAWLQSYRADIFHLKGDYPKAAEYAEAVGNDYYTGFATRLKQASSPGKRVRLPFEFVHQKHNTCAPATLAAIAHFWQVPITMEQIVDAICYDGTYDHTARTWCEANGFACREFRVTTDAVRLLIDAGVPFELSTVDVGNAHAQAVIGYDELRETIFIQDPSEPHYREVPAEAFLANYALTGPRGMVIVPAEKATWLNRLELPEAEIHDLNYRFSQALSKYDRETAVTTLQTMESLDSSHRLVLLGRLSLASFDGNDVAKLEGLDRLLEAFPRDPRLIYWKMMVLRSIGHRDARLELLRDVSFNHPALLREWGVELMSDAQDWPKARRILWRAHALMPSDGLLLVRLADLMRRTRECEEAEILQYYRFAAAFSDKVEGYAQQWFSYAVSQKRGEEALQWLQRRVRDYGAKSGAPAITLMQALDMLGREEIVDVVREAVALRPADGELLLELAKMETRLGDHAEAATVLERARGQVLPGSWLRARIALHRRCGEHAEEVRLWRQILEQEPLALDAHHALARELAASQGNAEAITHLQAVCGLFPHHYGLGQLLVGWLKDADLQKALDHVESMITLHPTDPWGHREKALILVEMGRSAAALAAAEKACVVAPDQSASHSVLGTALTLAGREAEAVQAQRQAVRMNVNYAPAFGEMLSLMTGTEAKRAELAFIRTEMIRQVLDGNALHAYRALAFTVLAPEELVIELREIWQARPDLWEAWSVLILQLLDASGHREEATQLARQAVERFPLFPAAWSDLATVLRLDGDHDGAIQAATKATQLNPDWAEAWRLLADYQDDAGRGDEALATLRRAIVRLPLEMSLKAALATLLWRKEQREEAWDMATKAAQTDPGQDWAWNFLKAWAGILQRQDQLLEMARTLTEQRPLEARSWHVYSNLLPLERVTEILAALDRAIELNPRLIDAMDHRADILARLGRLDEAEASLRRSFQDEAAMPFNIRGRLAWLKAVRGDAKAAMQQMKDIVEVHRDYYWGWEMIANWAEQSGQLKPWREAAEQMIRLSPRSSAPYCTAADAELHDHQQEAGIELLKRALHIDPTVPYAAHRLLGYYWEKKDIAALHEAATALMPDGTVGLIRRTYLMLAAAHAGDLDGVREHLMALATQPDMLGPLLSLMLDYFQQHNRRCLAVLDEVLVQVVKEDTIGPAFAILWTQRESQKKNWLAWIQLARWMPRLGARLDPAVSVYLEMNGEARQADPAVVQWIQRCDAEMRRRSEIWGKVSYALTNSQAYRPCVDWMWQDYKRPDAEAWMLSNLVTSLRCCRRNRDASEVSQHVVREGMRDHTWLLHVSHAALGYAHQGAYVDCKKLLDENDFSQAPMELRLLNLTSRALCDVMPVTPDQGRFWFKQFIAAAKKLVQGQPLSVESQRDYEEAVEKMKSHTGMAVRSWQKPKPYVPPREVPDSNSVFPRIVIGIMIFIAFQAVRNCATSPSTRYNTRETERILNEFHSRSEGGNKSAYPLSPTLTPRLPVDDRLAPSFAPKVPVDNPRFTPPSESRSFPSILEESF
ncbi:tetratricopeptide repeat protein [Prosthecobacter debontii]|uniref:tetratricopeptide repeat protein n=1 Tax=Prosthecobacter debontii TaxID=48467 RepID=UPI0015908A13|nr:tetratricopeptide repeat protein [Prosthecobacter debontii]